MLDPWSSDEVKDYQRLMKDFGIDRFDISEMPEEPEPPRLFREGIVFGQRGFDYVHRRIRKGEDFAIMSGLMPSGRMHLGHKMVIDQISYFQEFGAHVFIGVADLESYATRNMPLEKARRIAIDSYVRNYLALGIGREGLEIYFQSKRKEVKDLALLLGKKVNLATMKAIYGFDEGTNLGHLNSPMVQAGDILHPQLKLGPIPVVVPVGVDQDPHMRLCRDLSSSYRIYNATVTSDGKVGAFVKVDRNVEALVQRARSALEKEGYLEFKEIPRYKALYINGASPDDIPHIDEVLSLLERDEGHYGFIPPAATFHRFIKGLTGEKMSSSRPETAIFLDDDPADAVKKLKSAITGGRETAREQREKGGRPNDCSVFDTMLFHTVDEQREIDRIRKECLSGERLCGTCKKEAAEHMERFLTELKDRRDETEHLVDRFVMED